MQEDTNSTFQVKYISGFLTLMNRPAEFVFHDSNVKVILPAHKKKTEEVLFQVPVNEVKQILPNSAKGLPQLTYIVKGKKYGFLPGDTSFLGNLKSLNDKMLAEGMPPS